MSSPSPLRGLGRPTSAYRIHSHTCQVQRPRSPRHQLELWLTSARRPRPKGGLRTAIPTHTVDDEDRTYQGHRSLITWDRLFNNIATVAAHPSLNNFRTRLKGSRSPLALHSERRETNLHWQSRGERADLDEVLEGEARRGLGEGDTRSTWFRKDRGFQSEGYGR